MKFECDRCNRLAEYQPYDAERDAVVHLCSGCYLTWSMLMIQKSSGRGVTRMHSPIAKAATAVVRSDMDLFLEAEEEMRVQEAEIRSRLIEMQRKLSVD